MPVVGVITCEILELEFAYLLSMDQEIAGITVVEDSSSSGLLQSLKSLGRLEPRMTPLLNGFSPAFAGRMEVLVRVLELGLHSSKRLLQDGLGKAVREMARYVDGIFLGYGLCGNALQNPKELFADAGVPIFIPMDEDHPVDDCVGLIIGGRDRYYEEQCKEAGTFFMIPGWTKHWRHIFDKEIGKWDLQIAKRMFSSYKRSLLLPTPVLSEKEMMQSIEDFNSLFNLYPESQSGTLNLLQGAWEGAKKALQS
ncbi:MAG: DUF1638 domain-containing protein [Syntrophobacteraceae bacterium]|jgi:hypothetical protein